MPFSSMIWRHNGTTTTKSWYMAYFRDEKKPAEQHAFRDKKWLHFLCSAARNDNKITTKQADKAAQPRSSEKIAASRAGQTPCPRTMGSWNFAILEQ